MHEIGVIHHHGRSFSADGATVNAAGELSAYARDGGATLKSWKGRTLCEVSPGRVETAGDYWTEDWGDSYAIAVKLPRPGRNGGPPCYRLACQYRYPYGDTAELWIVGYSLGDGCLFRGELFAGTDAEARRRARDVAERWIERDREASEEDLEEDEDE